MLSMFQYGDLSDRVFAVVLHHPTAAQLAELESSRNAKRALEETFARLGKFEVSHFVLPTANIALPVSDP